MDVDPSYSNERAQYFSTQLISDVLKKTEEMNERFGC